MQECFREFQLHSNKALGVQTFLFHQRDREVSIVVNEHNHHETKEWKAQHSSLACCWLSSLANQSRKLAIKHYPLPFVWIFFFALLLIVFLLFSHVQPYIWRSREVRNACGVSPKVSRRKEKSSLFNDSSSTVRSFLMRRNGQSPTKSNV